MPQTKHAEGEIQPTPTQEENDLAMMGQHVAEKEHDGSPDDPYQPMPPEGAPEQPAQHKRKELQAEPVTGRGGYQTRQAMAERTRAPATPQPSHPPPLSPTPPTTSE